MAMIDPERERRRLAEFYSGQMDGELEKVAAEAYDLTDLAREVLRAELVKRGLRVALGEPRPVPPAPPILPGDPPPPPPEPMPDVAPAETATDEETELRNVVAIRRFRDLPEALLAKGGLESAGIEVALADDNMVRLDWFISNLLGGVKLLVKSEDAEAARQILDQPIPDELDVEGVGEYRQPRCPKCGSLDVNFQELDPAAYVSTVVSVPIPFHRRAWRCHSCRAEWEDDGTPDNGNPAAEAGS